MSACSTTGAVCEEYIANVVARGFTPRAAVINVPNAPTMTNGKAFGDVDLAAFKAFVDEGRALATGPRIFAINPTPNDTGGPGAAGDASTVSVMHPWSDPWWENYRIAMLYGGGVALDTPPFEFFSAFPTKVQQAAYQKFIVDILMWAGEHNLWSAVLLSPDGDNTKFLTSARRMVSVLDAAGALPNHWVSENYEECGTPYAQQCAPSAQTYGGSIGTETTPNSGAAIALWLAQHAPVRSYKGIFRGVTAPGQACIGGN